MRQDCHLSLWTIVLLFGRRSTNDGIFILKKVVDNIYRERNPSEWHCQQLLPVHKKDLFFDIKLSHGRVGFGHYFTETPDAGTADLT